MKVRMLGNWGYLKSKGPFFTAGYFGDKCKTYIKLEKGVWYLKLGKLLLRYKRGDFTYFLKLWTFRLWPFSISYLVTERDCDLAEVTYTETYRNGWIAWKQLNRIYENAEGPVSVRLISNQEAKTFQVKVRDLAAEKMNY